MWPQLYHAAVSYHPVAGVIRVARMQCLRRRECIMFLSLHCSADEDIDSKFPTNIVVYSDGRCSWVPLGLFISTCAVVQMTARIRVILGGPGRPAGFWVNTGLSYRSLIVLWGLRLVLYRRKWSRIVVPSYKSFVILRVVRIVLGGPRPLHLDVCDRHSLVPFRRPVLFDEVRFVDIRRL